MPQSAPKPARPPRAAIATHERLIFALDVPDASSARKLVGQLGDAVRFYKLGLELFMSGDYFELVDWLAAQGKKIFADLKFFDIPATVAAAVKGLRGRGVTFTTVHGYASIMEAAAQAKGDVKILAVTVLTSLDRRDLDELGTGVEVEQLVVTRARGALASGCDGVICSGQEAALVRQIDPRLLIVTPGIRPAQNRAADDQKRVVTVEQAFRDGVDHIVVGRPIRDAADPRVAAENIQRTIATLFST
jgi:orotidine-5'-phosphate decarboxylase